MPKQKIPIWIYAVVAVVACVASAVYIGRTYDVSTWKLGKEQADFWDVAVKGITAVLGVLGAGLATLKYLRDREDHNEAAKRESQKTFLEMRQDVYSRLGVALATIMNHDADDPTDTGWQPAKETFFTLYWGEIPLVADQPVAEAVEKFSDALFAIKDGEKKDHLADLSTAVTKACRKSLGDSWDVHQPKIDNNSFVPSMVRKRRVEESKSVYERAEAP